MTLAGMQGDFKALCQIPEVKKEIVVSLKKAGEAANLKGFERLADIYIDHEPFTVENNLITPTFKLKRPQVRMNTMTNMKMLMI